MSEHEHRLIQINVYRRKSVSLSPDPYAIWTPEKATEIDQWTKHVSICVEYLVFSHHFNHSILVYVTNHCRPSHTPQHHFHIDKCYSNEKSDMPITLNWISCIHVVCLFYFYWNQNKEWTLENETKNEHFFITFCLLILIFLAWSIVIDELVIFFFLCHGVYSIYSRHKKYTDKKHLFFL